jgi:endonuclease YncB( thermonuclease family)
MRITARLFGLLLLLALSAPAVWAEVLVGRVIAVADGDTVTVLDASRQQHRIRLVGIDAPERGQAFGNRARQHLADRVFQREVQVEYDKRDRYGRILGKIVLDGEDINLMMVRDGMAWHYRQFQRDQRPADRALYADAEREARATGRGLWADAHPLPPWEFRRQNR